MMHRIRLAALAIGLVLLGSCGGGGGESTPQGVTLSGTITLAETAAVDSDTNDVSQSADYRINDDGPRAQALTSPVLLVGTVNLANTGPAGNNFASGDPSDAYRVMLTAGQVVELEFSADPAKADVDLGLISVDGTQIGASVGVTSRFECVEVATSGEYFVVVLAFTSASIYNLRIGAPGTAGPCAQRTGPRNFAPAQLLALPKSGSAERERAQDLQQGAGIATRLQAAASPQLLRLPASARERAAGLAALGATSTRGTGEQPWSDVMDTLHYAKRLQASGAYVYVQPNYLHQRLVLTGTFPPDDRGYSYQRWHYEQINLPAAMSRIAALPSQPPQRPVVAVIDDGVVIDHPDLAAQLFPGGRAFITNTTSGDGNQNSADDPSAAGDSPVFHGTHVAGTAAAATFDGVGGAGVAPMAQVLPLRVFAPGRGALSNDIIEAMLYAARLPNNSGTLPARRADVINLSLGSDGACQQAFQDTIDRVRAEGVLVVAAAGNSARNGSGQRVAVGNPANCNGAIGVSATDNRKQITDYSNTGAQITVAAPGGDTAQSTTGNGAPDGIYSALGSFDAQGVRQPSFGPLQGTSMASPHVAGVMALMRYVHPALTPAQVDAMFAAGDLTDDLGAAGRDTLFGFGLIDARKAVDAALAAASSSPPPPPPGQIVANPSSIDLGSFQSTATLELAAVGTTGNRVTSITSDSAAVSVTEQSVDATSKLGSYTVTVNRGLLTGSGSFFPRLTVNLTSLETISVPLSITKPAAAGATGNFGPVYVFLIDPDTNAVVTTLRATHAAGRYTWSSSGYMRSRVAVQAGGDLDNNRFVCQRGEPCGAFPVLQTSGRPAPVTLGGNRNDLDFRIAPLSGISAQSMPQELPLERP